MKQEELQPHETESRGALAKGRDGELGRIMHSSRSVAAAAVMLLASSTAARAQDRERRGWLVLGVGTGSANIACDGDGCASGWNLHGPTLLGTVGFMVKPHLGVGLALDQWWRSPSDSEATSLGAVVLHYYPILRAGAFVEAGAGYSRAEVGLGGDTTARGKSVGLMAAVGYEVRVVRVKGGDITVTPRVSYVFSPVGRLTYAAGRPPFATGWRHQVLSVGLGVGFTIRQESDTVPAPIPPQSP